MGRANVGNVMEAALQQQSTYWMVSATYVTQLFGFR